MSEPSRKAFPATVVQIIDADRVALSRGSVDGVKKGQRFLVYTLAEELFDPETHESLGRLEIVRGTGIAVHVQERLTTLRSDATAPRSKRVIKRADPFGLLTGSRTEEVVEESGETPPFEHAQLGDLARPI